MATGLWVKITTVDHPASKPVGEESRFNIGAVMVPPIEGDSADVPKAGNSGEYRWVHYEGVTLAEYEAKLPEAIRTATVETVVDGVTYQIPDPNAQQGALRFIRPERNRLRTKADFGADVREGDKRTIMDRLTGRR